MEVKLYKSSDHPQLARLNKGTIFGVLQSYLPAKTQKSTPECMKYSSWMVRLRHYQKILLEKYLCSSQTGGDIPQNAKLNH